MRTYLQWSYKNGTARVDYTLDTEEKPYWVDDEHAKSLVEYFHLQDICKKQRNVPIDAITLRDMADWIEKGENIDLIVRTLRGLVEIYGDTNETND